ncbi:MAG: signal peptidase II [Gemmatimonadota bacterium]
MRPKVVVFLLIFPVILALDLATKSWALDTLMVESRELFGGLVPLTLAFNKGAAFGMSIGEDSRWFFIPVTIVALVLLGVLYKQAEQKDYLRLVSVSLVVSGAMGNLYDRVRWDRGVVDFLGPIELPIFGPFPIFNVADMAITCGAILLAISFWIEERQEAAREAAAKAEAVEGSASPDAGSSEAADVPLDAAAPDEAPAEG